MTQAPDFTLLNQNEDPVSLSGLLARGPVMVVFYPGDFTPICTKQLCSYQEAFDRFVNYGIQIVGISSGTPESHQRFKNQYRFAFDLLSDTQKLVTKAYGVTSMFMLGATSRAVFIVGRDRKILYRYIEPFAITHRKPDELLQMLDRLHAEGQLK